MPSRCHSDAFETPPSTPFRHLTQDTFQTSVVGDSGAAVFTSSRKELVRQGIPKEVIDASSGPPSTPFSMNTGNGTATVIESIGVSSDTFGSHECFLLPDCGMFLGAMGEVSAWDLKVCLAI